MPRGGGGGPNNLLPPPAPAPKNQVPQRRTVTKNRAPRAYSKHRGQSQQSITPGEASPKTLLPQQVSVPKGLRLGVVPKNLSPQRGSAQKHQLYQQGAVPQSVYPRRLRHEDTPRGLSQKSITRGEVSPKNLFPQRASVPKDRKPQRRTVRKI